MKTLIQMAHKTCTSRMAMFIVEGLDHEVDSAIAHLKTKGYEVIMRMDLTYQCQTYTPSEVKDVF